MDHWCTSPLNIWKVGTLMSADSFHHKVGKEMKGVKNVYDFNDFFKKISNCGNAIAIYDINFMQIENGMSKGKFTTNRYWKKWKLSNFVLEVLKYIGKNHIKTKNTTWVFKEKAIEHDDEKTYFESFFRIYFFKWHILNAFWGTISRKLIAQKLLTLGNK